MNLDERADTLDKELEDKDMNTSVHDLMKYGQRNRRLINWVIVSVVIELLLTIFLTAIFIQQKIQNNNITQNHENLLANCKSNNEFRASQVNVWSYVLAIPPATPQTAAQMKATADFKAYVLSTFALRNCNTFVK